MSLLSIVGATPSEGFELKSTRFDVGSQGRLMWTPSVEGNRRTWTFSCWAKRGSWNTVAQCLFSANNQKFNFEFTGTEDLLLNNYAPPYGNELIRTNARYRDPSAWYHIVGIWDTTNVTANDRIRLWVNGEQVTSFQLRTNPARNLQGEINTTTVHYIGARSNNDKWFDGYMAECYFIDGATLDASYFGETNELTGQWQPKNPTDIKPTVTFGPNGFYLPFSNDALATSFTDSSYGTVFTPTEALSVDYLVVAGGGGGGDTRGGGAGAGGMLSGTGLAVSATNYTVSVGDGGAGGTSSSNPGASGVNSVFSTLTAIGGGGGAGSASGGQATNGGSGGGGTQDYTPSHGTGTSGQGNTGGTGAGAPNYGAGGGGGKGAVGTNGTTTVGGNGGVGESNSITGSAVFYAGGGGGGTYQSSTAGSGGNGGGGDGKWNAPGDNGTANTGGGGGGGGHNGSTGFDGGAGGSGIVVIRYASATAKATGGTITTYTDGVQYQVHTFTSTIPTPRHTITANGDAKNTRISDHKVIPNGHANIIGPKQGTTTFYVDNGAANHLSMPDSADWMFGSGDFTIELWVNTTRIDQYQYIMGQIVASNGTDECFLRIQNDSTWRIGFVGASGGISVNSTSIIPKDTWTHLAAVRDGTTFRVYTNGVQEAINVYGTASQTEPTAVYMVGCTAYNDSNSGGPGAGYSGFYGYMDGVRISKGVCRYPDGTTFTPPTDAFTSDAQTVFLLQSGIEGTDTFTDTGNTTHIITEVGTVGPWIAPKIGTGMAAFDGTGDYITVADAPEFDFTGPFTIEFWFMTTDGSTAQAYYLKRGSEIAANIRIGVGSNAGKLEVLISSGTSGWNIWQNQDVAAISNDTWYHVALTWTGSVYTIWLDGVSKATATDSTYPTINTDVITIGGGQGGGANMLPGYLDEYRISNVCRYTSTFTPSTTAFKDDKDTVLLLHMDGGGNIVDGVPTAVGQGTYFWDASTNAIFYDSDGLATNKSIINFPNTTNNWLQSPDSVDWQLGDSGTGDFTWESWINPTDISSECRWWTQYTDANNRWSFELYQGKMNFYGKSGGTEVVSLLETNASIQLGKWQHVAFVRDGSTARFFVDGVSQPLTTLVAMGTFPDLSAVLYVGRFSSGSSQMFQGDVDQIRYSNSARYTGSESYTFTPTENITVNYLVVAGGGGGGSRVAGGGGAGGMRTGTLNLIADTDYTATVGQGGINGPAGTYSGSNGVDSLFSTITSTGGGGGAVGTGGAAITTGGSGGGGSGNGSGSWNSGAAGNTPSTSPAQGFDGGDGVTGSYYPSGGGGGAGGNGQTPGNSSSGSGNGGAGVASSITGTSVTYAGGGGGGGTSWGAGAGSGGTGGGGAGAASAYGTPGTANTGGGGGGGYNGGNDTGGAGGSGIVIVSYQSSTVKATGGTITTYGSGGGQYYVHTFNAEFTVPTTPFTADATTKLLIQSNFSEGGLGADHSGNYNYFTPTNLTTYDMVPDSPMNNFATWNSIALKGQTPVTLSEGNLKGSAVASGLNEVASTITMSSGKWYAEHYVHTLSGTQTWVGITDSKWLYNQTMETVGVYSVYKLTASANKRVNGTTSSYGDALVAGDILGMAYNADDNEMTFYRNGTTMGTITGVTTAEYVFTVGRADGSPVWITNFGQDSSFAGNVTAQGNQDGKNKGDFYYTPPSGFLALCSDNLPVPSIALPTDHFNTVLWTGDGAASRSITGTGFQADMMWSKIRNSGHQHNVVDRVRGVDKKLLMTNTNGAEDTNPTHGWFDSLDADGFTITGAGGDWNVNTNSYLYAGWNWAAGGKPTVDNSAAVGAVPTAGSVKINGANMTTNLPGSSKVTRQSANTTNGFSITEIEIVSGNLTFAHGLSQAPEFVIFKSITPTGDWYCQHQATGNAVRIMLNSTATYTGSTSWGSTSPTASVVSASINHDNPSIAYCFHGVEGFSKFGSYSGNGTNNNGPFAYCGFKPAYILIRDTTTAEDWLIYDNKRDPYNAADTTLEANDSAAENANGAFELDMLSNGFKIRESSSDGRTNRNNDVYIFAAFAESPFKTSNAR